MPVDTRLIIERRHEDGEWEEVGTARIDGWECGQIALVLSGIDLGAFAAMPTTAQARVERNILNGEPPGTAMD